MDQQTMIAFHKVAGTVDFLGAPDGEAAYAYVRVATIGQAEDVATSLIGQFSLLHSAAKAQGLRINSALVFGDIASGNSLNRPGLHAMLDDMRSSPKAVIVLVGSVDRLSRQFRHQLMLQEDFNTLGLTLRDAEGQVENPMLCIEGLMMAHRENSIVKRMQAGKQRKK